MPAAPATRRPTSIDALTAMAPGDAWAMAVMSSISSSSSHFSSSTKRFFISETITKPPPKVNALMASIEWNSVHSSFPRFGRASPVPDITTPAGTAAAVSPRRRRPGPP